MKQHLNTLFVTTDGAYLAKDGEAVSVRIDRKSVLRVPLHNLDGVVCFGRVGVSPALMAACSQANVTISLLNAYGRFQAAIVGFTPGNVVLRRQQYRAADDPNVSVEIAANMVAAKIANCRSVLLRGVRDGANAQVAASLNPAILRLGTYVEAARTCAVLDQLRGIEGEAASVYFSVFNGLIATKSPDFAFTSRSRRPPLDRTNCLLSFLYAMLAHDARSACEATGLDAAVGFLHRDRPGRPGLALDLMEEFRPFLVDRLVLSLVNRRQVSADGFEVSGSGAVLMNDKTRKEVLVAYQKRKQAEITQPFLNEKMSVGMLIHIQARLLARRLRGDLNAYPPFIWK